MQIKLQILVCHAPNIAKLKYFTDCCEIQDVEGVKRIAPPLTAQTNGSTGSILIASDSL